MAHLTEIEGQRETHERALTILGKSTYRSADYVAAYAQAQAEIGAETSRTPVVVARAAAAAAKSAVGGGLDPKTVLGCAYVILQDAGKVKIDYATRKITGLGDVPPEELAAALDRARHALTTASAETRANAVRVADWAVVRAEREDKTATDRERFTIGRIQPDDAGLSLHVHAERVIAVRGTGTVVRGRLEYSKEAYLAAVAEVESWTS
jgi:hypothetical protein